MQKFDDSKLLAQLIYFYSINPDNIYDMLYDDILDMLYELSKLEPKYGIVAGKITITENEMKTFRLDEVDPETLAREFQSLSNASRYKTRFNR